MPGQVYPIPVTDSGNHMVAVFAQANLVFCSFSVSPSISLSRYLFTQTFLHENGNWLSAYRPNTGGRRCDKYRPKYL